MGSHCFTISWVSTRNIWLVVGEFKVWRLLHIHIWGLECYNSGAGLTWDIHPAPHAWPIYVAWVSPKHGDHRVGRLASWKLRASIEYVPRKQGKRLDGFFMTLPQKLHTILHWSKQSLLTMILERRQRPSDTQWDFQPS